MPTAFDFHRESSISGSNLKPPPILVNTAHGPVSAATQCQSAALKTEAPRSANRKRAAVSFVPSKERLQEESLRWKVIRHSMLCRQGDCSEYPNGVCARMKDTLSHVARCNNMKCTVVDCVGTRSMIKHMSQCRSKKCLVCGPAPQPLPPHSATTTITAAARATTPDMTCEQDQEQPQQQHEHQYGTRGSSPLKKRRVTLEHGHALET
jgi:TAZ zinc finger